MKLQYYTLRYLVIALLAVIALWASLFYLVILDEVYDNINDGLKNSKIIIIRETFKNPKLLDTPEYGANQYIITPLPKGNYSYKDELISTMHFMEYDDDYQPVRILKTVFNDAKGQPHLLQIRASIVEEDELMEDLLIALIALYGMLVISILAVNHWVLKRVWKSFHLLLLKLQDFKLGTGHHFQAPPSPVNEFKELGAAIEKMLQRNEIIYSSQKQFIENAAHELQTPLAITINKLELFAENNAITEEQMVEIGQISETISRLIRLNKSLLMLSRIENQQFTDEEVVNFNTLTHDLVEDFSDLSAYKKVTISIAEIGLLNFKMNKGLASTLISNLLKNALNHNYPEGFIEITISNTSFKIKNSSPNMPLNPEYIYNRFYRHTTHAQSTGLGLAIVRSIIVSYSLVILYNYNNGHEFEITFPI
ncbi:sensor histidine kinase [Flavobacterium sp. '19STA2R22 D10 B1']|uniref:sensor histidine kinase n=1 Tax=Flavobacterium aerium TaxID=3037261 RepID=UPI00278C0A34|nr:HAMP domain-containing sensor histidine kinase [Flavobacterium sp. '19STA2R22 D10 B1']